MNRHVIIFLLIFCGISTVVSLFLLVQAASSTPAQTTGAIVFGIVAVVAAAGFFSLYRRIKEA